MDHGDVLRRLSILPDPLPHGTRAIDPILMGRPADLAADQPADQPIWGRSAPMSTRRTAALVLLFPDAAGETRLVLTERPAGLRHGGQVSFPGGEEDPGDEFPVGTALREAWEEVALDPDQAGIRVLGHLDVVDVRVSGFLLTPVLAVADRLPSLVAASSEVATILLPRVARFLPDALVTSAEMERDGVRIRYAGYPYGGRHIWGATARALAQLGAIISGDEQPRS